MSRSSRFSLSKPGRKYNAYGVVKIRRGREAYTNNWPDISKKIKQRDGYRCTKCGSTEHLEVHHIIPISRGGGNSSVNLTTLCRRCHARQPNHTHL